MEAIHILDVASLAVLYVFLSYFSKMDRDYRYVPLSTVVMFAASSIVVASARFYLADTLTLTTYCVSLILTGLLASTFLVLIHLTKMVGVGDIIVVLLTGIMCPYAPYPEGVRALPIINPVATAISALLMYIELRKSTVYIPSFPPRFRRVRKHRVSEIRKDATVKEYPVYIEGVGFVYDKIFASSPVENTLKIIQNVPDDAVIYTVPNFPFIFYFTVGHIIAVASLVLVYSMISLL
ncbi:MAG: hypothetical protein QXQ90_05315 [Desulfurococcaceae archaeon]